MHSLEKKRIKCLEFVRKCLGNDLNKAERTKHARYIQVTHENVLCKLNFTHLQNK